MKNLLPLVALMLVGNSHAENNLPLPTKREVVLNRYLDDLANANYQDMITLFEKDGYVVTRKGKMDAKEFFYNFLPNIKSAYTEPNRVFNEKSDANILALRFHFDYSLKDGTQGNGEYIDEFTFTENSTKLKSVYMFENLNFSP